MVLLELSLFHDKGIRGMTIIDALNKEEERYSVFDFINCVCEKDIKDSYAQKTFDRLKEKKSSELSKEVMTSCLYLQFEGKGQRKTPTMTIRGLSRLLMVLDNKVASAYRLTAEVILNRVIAGDRSLIKVIEANAISNSPMQQVVRNTLLADGEPIVLGVTNNDHNESTGEKRMREVDFDEVKQNNIKQKIDNLEHIINVCQKLAPGGELDHNTRATFHNIMLKHLVKDYGTATMSSQPVVVPLVHDVPLPLIPASSVVPSVPISSVVPSVPISSVVPSVPISSVVAPITSVTTTPVAPVMTLFNIYISALINWLTKELNAKGLDGNMTVRVHTRDFYNAYNLTFFSGFADRSRVTFGTTNTTGVFITKQYMERNVPAAVPPNRKRMWELLSVQTDHRTSELMPAELFWGMCSGFFRGIMVNHVNMQQQCSHFVFVPERLRKRLIQRSTPTSILYDPEITLDTPLMFDVVTP